MSEPVNPSRVCVSGGFLVGPKVRLPEDPRYFQTAGAKYLVGCNQLRCRLCGGKVRQQVGFRDASAEAATRHARDIYDTPDFGKSPYMVADPNSRAYACGCTVVMLSGDKSSPFPNGTWSCAGHPEVDGEAAMLPPMTQDAASAFAVMVANSHLQQAINLLGITFTDGTGMLAMPANISLGGGMPGLKLWTNETTNTPLELDFAKVAGACVQLKDKTLLAY